MISWNIEGFSRGKHALKQFLNLHRPDFVFLSEPLLYQCDLPLEMKLFEGEYILILNSEDQFDLDLPFLKRRARGGTMAMIKTELFDHSLF